MGNTSNGDYISDFTGDQIDEAIANANEALQKAEANETALGGKASQTNLEALATIVSALASRVASLEQNGGGATSSMVISNVDSLQQKIDELIGSLANSAFKTAKPDLLGALDWQNTYYTVSFNTSAKFTMTNSATRVEAGQTYTNTITARSGYSLTSVTLNGVAQTITDNQCVITVTNVQANITLTISAQSDSATPSTTYSVTPSLDSDLTMTPNGGNVVSGGTFSAVLAIKSGVTGKRLPDSITIAGLFDTKSYDRTTGEIEITGIESNITIAATAATSSSGVIHSVAYNLTGCEVSSGDNAVEDGGTLTAVISKVGADWDALFTDSQNTAWKEYFNFLARDFVVTMGGRTLERDSDFTAVQSGANGDTTITIENVTGDIEILYVLWLRGGMKYTTGEETSATTSARTTSYIPVPGTCEKVAVFGCNVENNTAAYIGCVFYNASKQKQGGVHLTSAEVVVDDLQELAENSQAAGVAYIKTSVKFKQNDTGGTFSRLDSCYIYDVTNDKFIWYGNSVNRASVRNNHLISQ